MDEYLLDLRGRLGYNDGRNFHFLELDVTRLPVIDVVLNVVKLWML